MSDNYLRLIPTDPTYLPSEDEIQKTLAILHQLRFDVTLEVVTWDNIEFVDQGANFETVCCPCCGCSLDVLWWAGQMSRSYEASHFRDRTVETLCCACATDLNDLRYSWPAGFARFMVELPNTEDDLSDAELHRLSLVLGIQLRKVWARY
ncbi:MAG: hypothetical protein U0822_13050 [Anaerolineae bacterium]